MLPTCPPAPLTLAASLDQTAVFFFGAVAAVIVIAIVTDALRKVHQTRAQEMTRREIAAYVAEGSISPEDAERLLTAGKKPVKRP